MKIAAFADIHGNYPAMQAVVSHLEAWSPDFVINAGDTINRGTRSKACFDLLTEKLRQPQWSAIKGNHEDYVLTCDSPDAPTRGPKADIWKISFYTLAQFGGDVSAIRAQADFLALDAATERDTLVAHASMVHNRRGIYPETTVDELRTLLADKSPSLFIVGHTHRPLTRTLDNTLIVNVGSAGLPFDGFWQPSYAQITYLDGVWQAEIVRVPYDWKAAARDFIETDFINLGGPLAHIILAELLLCRPLMAPWTYLYQKPVLDGEITLEQSVIKFLNELGVSYPVEIPDKHPRA